MCVVVVWKIAFTQKQACPFLPVMLRGSLEDESGIAHQFGLSNGKGNFGSTDRFHGARLPSMPCRGGGWLTAPARRQDTEHEHQEIHTVISRVGGVVRTFPSRRVLLRQLCSRIGLVWDRWFGPCST